MLVPTEAQQFAVQAKLNMALGKEVFDRLFLGMEIDGVSRGVMKIRVRSEPCALDIQTNHAGTIAVVAENVLRKPIKSVLVLPKTFRDTSPPPEAGPRQGGASVRPFRFPLTGMISPSRRRCCRSSDWNTSPMTTRRSTAHRRSVHPLG
jgi:hypothetical protein